MDSSNGGIGSVGRLSPGAFGKAEADRFARDLARLCQAHGVALLTPLQSAPMYISQAATRAENKRPPDRYETELRWTDPPVYTISPKWIQPNGR